MPVPDTSEASAADRPTASAQLDRRPLSSRRRSSETGTRSRQGDRDVGTALGSPFGPAGATQPATHWSANPTRLPHRHAGQRDRAVPASSPRHARNRPSRPRRGPAFRDVRSCGRAGSSPGRRPRRSGRRNRPRTAAAGSCAGRRTDWVKTRSPTDPESGPGIDDARPCPRGPRL